MSIRWERFAGDTSTFALRLAFLHDPDDGAAATPEMSESWGALQIWVDGKNLCAHVDQGETLHSAHWYFLPLLEWLCANWDPLLHEERLPVGNKGVRNAADVQGAAVAASYTYDDRGERGDVLEYQYEWQQRHSLWAARDGGLLPDVRLRRLRDQIEVAWASTPLAGASDVQFLAPEGTQFVDPQAVAQPLYEILSCAAEWLHERLPGSKQCEELVDAVNDLRSPERAEQRTAWVAGLGSNQKEIVSRWRRIRESVERAGTKAGAAAVDAILGPRSETDVVLSGSCAAALLFGSAAPSVAEADALSLAEHLLEAYDPAPADGLADAVWDVDLDPRQPPWKHGYELADELLEEFDEHFEIEPWKSEIPVEAFLRDHGVRIDEIHLSDANLRAVSFVSEHHSPTILLNLNHWSSEMPPARRFTLAHELCHLLHDRSHGASLAIASGPWAPQAIEQRANAFAAFLLMPPDRVQSVIASSKSPIREREGIQEVARRLNVSQTALVDHLWNLGFIDEEDRPRLRSAVSGLSSADFM